MIQVSNSKNISTVDFHQSEGTEVGTLTVLFHNGRTYAYESVPAGIYEALALEAQRVDADASVGRTFNKLVRSGGFEFSEITE